MTLLKCTRIFVPAVCCMLAAACGAPNGDENEQDITETAAEELSVHRDDLNGLWITHVNPTTGVSPSTREAIIEAWPALGVRLTLVDGNSNNDDSNERIVLTPSGSKLLAPSPAIALVSHPNATTTFDDDVIDGTIGGIPVSLERDVTPKPPITLALPGDRPFRSFLVDQLTPAAQRDRESYVVLSSNALRTFLHKCVAYTKGYWQYKYLAGVDRAEENESLEAIVDAIDGVKTTPHRLIREPAFAEAVKANVRAAFLSPQAVSDLGLYFSTAAGRSVHLSLASDTKIWFITDRTERKEKLGLVLTESPLHAPLAITFGGQLFELTSMAKTDDVTYAAAMMDLLTRSDSSRVAQLSPAGRAAIADWYGVMAIEDYRGVTFNTPNLGWGYNFTNAQLYGLVVRALGGQVIIGSELRPGDASYADVLNDGKDMQEYPDMAKLKQLATGYLLDYHPNDVKAVLNAFAGVVPSSALDTRAKYDVFHFVCAQLYDALGRTANLTATAAKNATTAVATLIDILGRESAQLETYIRAKGYTKSTIIAPKVNGI